MKMLNKVEILLLIKPIINPIGRLFGFGVSNRPQNIQWQRTVSSDFQVVMAFFVHLLNWNLQDFADQEIETNSSISQNQSLHLGKVHSSVKVSI